MFTSFAWVRSDCDMAGAEEGSALDDACSPGKGVDGACVVRDSAPSSCSSSDCSETEYMEEASAGSALAGGGAYGGGDASRAPPVTAAVRDKAAYFEALIRSNTTALIRCEASERGTPRSADGSIAALRLRGAAGAGAGAAPCGASAPASPGEGEYSEVHMTLRLPKFKRRQVAPPSPGSVGSGEGGGCALCAGGGQAEVEELRARLARAEGALARRDAECANLARVVKELSESRVKAVCGKASLQEKYAELQQEFHRALRIAELSRSVSKENLARTSRAHAALRAAQRELSALRARADAVEARADEVGDENLDLKERIGLLQRLDFEAGQQSVCMRYFTRYRIGETY